MSSSKTSSVLSLYDRLYIRFFYFMRSLKFDLPENRVGWRSRQNQELRFRALADIAQLKGQRVLDLGSGLGCLYGYLKAGGWQGEYTGMDILGRMVRGAKERFPEAAFEKRDILQDPPDRRWDYVLISGIFNHKVKDNWGWMEETIRVCWALAEKGVAFNVLHTEGGWLDQDLFYADLKTLAKKADDWSGGKYQIVKGLE